MSVVSTDLPPGAPQGSPPGARDVIASLHALRRAPRDAAWWPRLANTLLWLCRARSVCLARAEGGALQALARAGDGPDPLQPASQADIAALQERAAAQGQASSPARDDAGRPFWWAALPLPRLPGGWLLLALADAERARLNELMLRAQLVADLPGADDDAGADVQPAATAVTATTPAGVDTATDLPLWWHRLADVAAQVGGETRFEAAALALVNALAARCDAAQAVLGWRAGPGTRPQVVAISHRDKFDRGSAPIARTEDALDEALDFEGGVELPLPQHRPPLHDAPAHALLQDEFETPLHLWSLPLARRGQPPRGVLLLAFTTPPPALLHTLLPASLQQLLPTLEMLHARERAWPLRLKDHLLATLQRWLGPGHAGWKATAAVGSAALLYALFAHWDYRVAATGQIATDSTRVLAAQFDSRVEQASVTAGDEVRAGQVLARLDTRELRQQEVETRAELKRHLAEADQARASGALAQLEVAGARAAQAEARLARLQDLLAQAVAAAPFDGVVVDGERQVLQGAPVRKGDPLYRVARIEGLYATLLVPERDAALVTPGSTGALILVSRPDERIPLRVEAVIPVARTQGSEGNQFLVRAAFTGDVAPWWRPGMSGSARIDAGERRVIWILTHRLVDRLRLWLWW
jgi:RND family efflux transporter MFP subunit